MMRTTYPEAVVGVGAVLIVGLAASGCSASSHSDSGAAIGDMVSVTGV